MADTVVPRLIAAGAELDRVCSLPSVNNYENDMTKDVPVCLSRDLHQLDGMLTARRETRAVIFDPLSAYLGAKDSHRDSDVREVLGPLCDLAAKHNVTIIGITHLSKNEGVSAMARFMGSTGIIAASRAAFLATRHDDKLMLLPVKSNLAPLCKGLIYEIRTKTIEQGIETSYIEWVSETDIKPDDILQTAKHISNSPALAPALEFLRDQLAGGSKIQAEIRKDAESTSEFKWRTVLRAKDELGIVSKKESFSGGWRWYTPHQYAQLKDQLAKVDGNLRKSEETQGHYFGILGEKQEQDNPTKDY
jgi:putative DNA primase/helicase